MKKYLKNLFRLAQSDNNYGITRNKNIDFQSANLMVLARVL